MILIIDNYDSFVYNLARYVNELGFESVIKRNDVISLEEITDLTPSHVIISPGPCAPQQAGISVELVKQFGATIPILGVCLGHQAIGQAYGGNIRRAKFPMHGKASVITHNGKNLFLGLKNSLRVGRYHSLVIGEENFPAELDVIARCEQGEIMAIQHRYYPVFGVQFHPESILTESGYQILQNFLTFVFKS